MFFQQTELADDGQAYIFNCAIKLMGRLYQITFADRDGEKLFTENLPYIPRTGEFVVRHVKEEGHNEEHYCVNHVKYHFGKRGVFPNVTISVDLKHTAWA